MLDSAKCTNYIRNKLEQEQLPYSFKLVICSSSKTPITGKNGPLNKLDSRINIA